MNARNNNKPELLTDQAEFEARATRKGTRGVSFVSKAIKAWRKAAPDRFRVFFYDDLAADSGVFRTSVAEFIGLDPEGFGEDAYVRSNAYPSIPAPDAYRAWMADYFAEEYEQLAELLGGHAIKWRHKNLEMRKSLACAS